MVRESNLALLAATLDRSSDVHLNRQLYLQIRDKILSGRLPAGTWVPSTRQLASDLRVSRTVTLAAYDQLHMEGYLESRRGSGTYVRQLTTVRKRRPRRTEKKCGEPSNVLVHAPFDPAAQPSDLFPHRKWSVLLARGWRRDQEEISRGDHWGGLWSLRVAIADYLHQLKGIECFPEQVIVTAGNADSLQLILSALLPGTSRSERKAWVEDPGYVGARDILTRHGLSLVPVPVDDEGLDVEAGIARAPGALLALVTPARQFPLGMPLSLSRRLALLQWSLSTGALILEDDYDSELRFKGRPLPSLLSLNADADVLLLGGFSKLTFPGMRLSYIVGKRDLADRLKDYRAKHREVSPVAAQSTMAQLMETGAFAGYLRRLRRVVSSRGNALTGAIRKELGKSACLWPREVGMHVTVELAERPRKAEFDRELATKAARNGLCLSPLSTYSIGSADRQGFVLGYAAWNQDVLVDRVRLLARLLTRKKS